MTAEIVDTVAVMNRSIFLYLIKCTEAVLYYHQRSLWISAMEIIQGVAQTIWVNLPAPVRSLQIWILYASSHISRSSLCIFLYGYAAGHVVGEGVHIYYAFLDNLLVFLGNVGIINAILLKETVSKLWIFTTNLNITAEIILEIILIHASQNILWIWSQRVNSNMSNHITNHEIRINLMTSLYSQSRSYKFIMESLAGSLQIAL